MGTTEARWRRALFPSLLVVFVVAYAWRMSGLVPVEPLSNHLKTSPDRCGPDAAERAEGFRQSDPAKARALFAALLGAVNVVAEMILALGDIEEAVNRAMGDVNTTDPVDGLFGLATVALVVVLLPPGTV